MKEVKNGAASHDEEYLIIWFYYSSFSPGDWVDKQVFHTNETPGVESGKCFFLLPLNSSAQWLDGAVCVKEILMPSWLCDEAAAVGWVQKDLWLSL